MVIPMKITGWQVECNDVTYGTFSSADAAGEWLFDSGHYEGVIIPVFQPFSVDILASSMSDFQEGEKVIE